MTTGQRLFCQEFLRFNTMPCRYMPVLVHLRGIIANNLNQSPDGPPLRDRSALDFFTQYSSTGSLDQNWLSLHAVSLSLSIYIYTYNMILYIYRERERKIERERERDIYNM